MTSYNARNKGVLHRHTKTSKNATNTSINDIINTAQTNEIGTNSKKDIGESNNVDHEATIGVQNGIRNRRIKGQETTKSTITKIVSEVIPQTTSLNQNIHHEKINWAKIQLCSSELDEYYINYVIIIGLARGYQIFIYMCDGNFEEIISVRNSPLKIGHLLPFKAKLRDRFSEQRPLLALYAMENGARVYIINFMSLLTGKMAHQIDCLKPVLEIDSSSNCLLILMEQSITIYEHENFVQRYSFLTNPSPHSSYLPIYSLSENLLAIADSKLNESMQSIGGYAPEPNEQSSKNQMINTAKNLSQAVTTISESIISTLSHTPSTNYICNDNKTVSGVVSVLNVDGGIRRPSKKFMNANDYVAHFQAHSGIPISHLKFSHGGQLLLTSSVTGTVFNVFLLHLHPTVSSLSSIQHIYTLNRGNTAAKVIESAFSFDNRWLTISTNHGTTHLFAINPYGGITTSRTHSGELMNKEGKFEKTAGIRFAERTSQLQHSKTVKIIRIHPGLKNNTIVKTTTNLGSCFSLQTPLTLNSVAVLKQRIFSAENLCAWASDNTPSILLSAKRRKNSNHDNLRGFGRILTTKFSTFRLLKQQKYPNTLASLLIMNNEGMLTEYALRIFSKGKELSTLKQNHNAIQFNKSLNSKEYLAEQAQFDGQRAQWTEQQFTVKLSPTLQWEFTRSKNTTDFELVGPPLPSTNPLIQFCGKEQQLPSGNKSKQNASGSWLPFLELITYTGPHRRLWLGPQFNFSVYTSTESSISAPCILAEQISGTAKCCPVLIEKNSSHKLLARKSELSPVARIICGSWSSDFDPKPLNEISLVKEKIEDAMTEANEREKKVSHNEEEEEKSSNFWSMEIEPNKGVLDEDDDDACLMLSGIDL